MKAIFLDRDGVIIRKAAAGDYIKDWCEVEFLPGSLEAMAAFSRFGYKVIIVTNQRGVATGQIKPDKLLEIHTKLKESVANMGGDVVSVYCCTHDTSDNCDCRKPKPGMLSQAARDHRLCLNECWMVGDAASDIAAGKSAGCKTVLIASTEECPGVTEKPEIVSESLALAVERILSSTSAADERTE